MDNIGMDNASDMNQAPVEPVAQQQTERVFKQSELNEIVGRAKHEAVESYKRNNQPAPQQNPSSLKSLSEDDVKRLTSEELNRQREEWERQNLERQHAESAQRIVNSYKEKIAAGKDKYEDFDSVVNDKQMGRFPYVVQLLADHVDNAADVAYELSRNRTKMHQLESMCREDNAEDAIYEINRLAKSIKANENSSQMKTSNSPLSQQRPSNTGTDSGSLSLRDLKMKYRG